MPTTSTSPVVTPVLDVDVQRAAFERMRPRIEAVAADKVMRVNVDVAYAAGLGVWIASRIEPLRPKLDLLAPFVDLEAIRELAERSHALLYAHGDYLFATTPEQPIAELNKEGAQLIEFLLLGASALSAQGLLPDERVELVRRPAGYRDTAEHLTALSRLYKDHWSVIQSKTGVTLEQVDRGGALAVQLLQGSIERMHGRLSPSEASLTRGRAYTLFYQAYNEVRRGVTFLRWHEEDVESFVPTLFLRDSKRKGDAADEPSEQTVAEPASSPVEPAAVPAIATPVGHRGGSPFSQV